MNGAPSHASSIPSFEVLSLHQNCKRLFHPSKTLLLVGRASLRRPLQNPGKFPWAVAADINGKMIMRLFWKPGDGGDGALVAEGWDVPVRWERGHEIGGNVHAVGLVVKNVTFRQWNSGSGSVIMITTAFSALGPGRTETQCTRQQSCCPELPRDQEIKSA